MVTTPSKRRLGEDTVSLTSESLCGERAVREPANVKTMNLVNNRMIIVCLAQNRGWLGAAYARGTTQERRRRECAMSEPLGAAAALAAWSVLQLSLTWTLEHEIAMAIERLRTW